MENKKLKINTYVYFDSIKEADLIHNVERLIQSRQLSKFVTNALKIVLENKELFKAALDGESEGSVTREDYFNSLGEKINSLWGAINKVETEARHTKEFLALHKMLGIEMKSDNVMCADLLIKNQIRDLNRALGKIGVDVITDKGLVQEELESIDKRSEKLALYTVEHFDGVMSEIKSLMGEIKVTVENNQPIVVNQTSLPETQDKKDEPKEITQKDISTMAAFFGDD